MGAIPAAAGKHRAHGALLRARWRSGRCEALRPDVRWRAAFGMLHPHDAATLAGGGLHGPPALAETGRASSWERVLSVRVDLGGRGVINTKTQYVERHHSTVNNREF